MATATRNPKSNFDFALDQAYNRGMTMFDHKGDGLPNVPKFTISGFVAWCSSHHADEEEILLELRRRHCLYWTEIVKFGPQDVLFCDIPLKHITAEQLQALREGKTIRLRTGFLSWKRIHGKYWIFRRDWIARNKPLRQLWRKFWRRTR